MVTKVRRDFAALEARRLQAARLFSHGETRGAVARALGVTAAAVNHWHQRWRAKGRRGLKGAGRAGRKPTRDAQQLAKVERAFRAGPGADGFTTELWTLPPVAAVIQRMTGVRHHPSHVGRLLQQLDWSFILSNRCGATSRARRWPTSAPPTSRRCAAPSAPA